LESTERVCGVGSSSVSCAAGYYIQI
jgi:hypothetical protein